MLDKNNVEDILALNSAQEGLLFHYLHNPEENYYCEQICIELEGDFNPAYFTQACRETAGNYESLRSVFRWEKLSSPVQVILKEHRPDIRFYDISDVSPTEQPGRIREIIAQDLAEGFDLEQVPLRLKVLKAGASSHLIMLSYHHILFDGWSLGILINDLFGNYISTVAGALPARQAGPALKKYLAFLKKQDKTKLQYFWKEYLKDCDPRFFNKNAGLANAPAARLKRKIKLDDQSIGAYATRHQITLASFVYGVWGLILHKYHNTSDVIFGAVVSGRTNTFEGVEKIIGLLSKTLPLRIKIQGEESVADYLIRVRRQLDGWIQHDQSALVDILAALDSEHHGEIFDTLIAVENYPISPQLKHLDENLNVAAFSFAGTNHYEISLTVNVLDGIEVDLSVNPATFDAEGLNRLAGHFEQAVAQVLRNPDGKVREVNVLGAAEEEQLLYGFNDTRAAYPDDQSLVDLFETQAAANPQAVAVVFEEQSLTYGQLDEQANQLAHYLIEAGLVPGQLVGLCLERSLHVIVGILGVLKAGGAYVPIEPDFPRQRIDYMVNDTALAFLLVDDTGAHAFSHHEHLSLIHLEQEAPRIGQAPTHNLATGPGAGQPAYVMYTSGSTGQPKGTLVGHRGVVNLLTDLAARLPVTSRDVFFSVTNYTFDISVLEFFLPLLNGARLVVASRLQKQDPAHCLDALAGAGATLMQATPSYFALLLEQGWQGSPELTLLCGGERLPAALAGQLRQVGKQLYNMYGPTETTIWSSCYRVEEAGEPVLIGKPVANTQFYVLDKQRALQPIGVVGEIYIGGAGLAAGYLNKVRLTEQQYIAHPFAPSGRLYATGDFGRWQEDGNIDFMGRVDDQVKLRGYRIELKEIEHVLNQHDSVSQSLVVEKTDAKGEKHLVAYLVGEETADPAALAQYLRGKLPGYMVPSYLVRLAAFPLNASGKIDKKALPDPAASRALDQGYVAPRTAAEAQIGRIWQDLLGVEQVGIHDNFFELGGNSMKLVQLATRIRRELNFTFELGTLFHNPTIEAFCRKAGTPGGSRESRVYPLNAFDAANPYLFCVPPLLGVPALYRKFAALLEKKINVYGLQYRGLALHETEEMAHSVEELVRHLAEEIIPVCQANHITRCYLLGYSFGVYVAFELARQLEARGIGLKLILVDAVRLEKARGATEAADIPVFEANEAFAEALQNQYNLQPEDDQGFAREIVGRINQLYRANLQSLDRHVVQGTVRADTYAIKSYNDDPGQNQVTMASWQACVQGRFAQLRVRGEHDELFHNRYEELAAMVRDIVDESGAWLPES